MPTSAIGNTVYTHPVAKVMISIPDDLLERLDAQARADRETRSGFLQRLAERELRAPRAASPRGDRRAARARPSTWAATPRRLIREDRESH